MVTVPANGLAFDVTLVGDEAAHPVLLLHGFPQGAACWAGLSAVLAAAGLRSVAPDLRGYSPGARPAEVAQYRAENLVADVMAIMDAFGLGRVDVVGHDWGGLIGWWAAAGRPDRIRTLTAVSAPHPASLRRAILADDDQRRRSAYLHMFWRPGTAERWLLADGANQLRALLGGVADPETVEGYVRARSQPGALTAALAWYRATRYADPPGEVSVPATLVHGLADAAIGQAAVRGSAGWVRGPLRIVELEGVGHWVPEQAPAELGRIVLEQVAAGGPGRPGPGPVGPPDGGCPAVGMPDPAGGVPPQGQR